MSSVSVVLTPTLFSEYANPDAVVAVVDVLRATSTIAAALDYGVEAVVPVQSIDEAWQWKSKGLKVGGERNGQKVDGFDFGNSPYDYMQPDLKGETVVLTTTNGTQAFAMAADQSAAVIGASLVNLTASINWLERQNRDVIILCAGWKNKFSLEDTVCAGALANGLVKRGLTPADDTVLAARTLCEQAQQNPQRYLTAAFHRKRLMRLNLKRDIRYCLTPDQCDVIPILNGDRLVRAGGENG